jgi:hypothetical protein
MIQDNLIWVCLRRRVKNDSKFSILLPDSLGGSSTPWRKMHHPRLERQDVAIFFFLIHCFCGNLWMHTEGVLVPFLENHVFIVIFLLKVKMRWAFLFNDSLDMVAIFFVKKRGDLCRDGSNISCENELPCLGSNHSGLRRQLLG